jgi:hypothetical protein
MIFMVILSFADLATGRCVEPACEGERSRVEGVISNLRSEISDQRSAISYQLSEISNQQSAISNQQSADNRQQKGNVGRSGSGKPQRQPKQPRKFCL